MNVRQRNFEDTQEEALLRLESKTALKRAVI
jgi:hypothetical protein